ncbi:MAG: TlpA disulfide reductase family protein [Sphingobacteriia bacterium]
MGKSIILFVCLLPIFALSQNNFTVTLKLKGLEDHKVKVFYQINGKSKSDTLVKQSTDLVIWKGSVDEPQLARIEVLDTSLNPRAGKAVMQAPILQFLLMNADIEIQADAKEIYRAVIKSANKEINLFEELRASHLPFDVESWNLQKEMNRKLNAGDTTGNYLLRQQSTVLRQKNQALKIKFVDEHPNSYSSILLLNGMSLILSAEAMSAKYNKINDELKNTATAQVLSTKIENNKKTAIGKPAILFSQVGIDGNIVDVAALKGKVILIDFWGSWCVPCRLSHPALKELYAKYESKGFEIIGISNEWSSGQSIAVQTSKWKKAVKEDGINWLHILYNPEIRDLVKEFDINAYPTKFLIDQNGKFIMKFPGNSEAQHKALADKLASLLPE